MRRRGWLGTPQYESIVAALVEAREAAGLTQRDLAARLGVAQSRIGRIESGQRNVSVLELVALARALGREPVELFTVIADRLPERYDL